MIMGSDPIHRIRGGNYNYVIRKKIGKALKAGRQASERGERATRALYVGLGKLNKSVRAWKNYG